MREDDPQAGHANGARRRALAPRRVRAALESLYYNLCVLGADGAPRQSTFAVTSTCRREGVSTVAIHLALTLGEHCDGKVLLIDANPLHPRLHKVCGHPMSPGLGEALAGHSVLAHRFVGQVEVLPAGSLAEALAPVAGESFAAFLRDQCARYERIVIDLAPVLDSTFGARAAAAADGTILVVRARHVVRESALRARDRLTSSGADVVGVVLNRQRRLAPFGR